MEETTRMGEPWLDPETGRVWNGFDYRLQVWVVNGVVRPCSHPERMRTKGPCCNQDAYAGLSILEIEGAESFW